jgi:DNA-binding GntR family transcriptional regulator
MDAAENMNDGDAYFALNVEFHDRIVDYTENDRLRAICEGLAKELRLYRRRSLMTGDGLHASNREHHEILNALANRDPVRASAALEGHLLASKDRFLDATDIATPAPDSASDSAPERKKK